MKTRVTFTHDDECQKWEATVDGVANEAEAAQAFAAVVVTCKQLEVRLLPYTRVEQLHECAGWDLGEARFKITPAVEFDGKVQFGQKELSR